MVLSRPFKREYLMEQISSSCPQKLVSLGFEEVCCVVGFFHFIGADSQLDLREC